MLVCVCVCVLLFALALPSTCALTNQNTPSHPNALVWHDRQTSRCDPLEMCLVKDLLGCRQLLRIVQLRVCVSETPRQNLHDLGVAAELLPHPSIAKTDLLVPSLNYSRLALNVYFLCVGMQQRWRSERFWLLLLQYYYSAWRSFVVVVVVLVLVQQRHHRPPHLHATPPHRLLTHTACLATCFSLTAPWAPVTCLACADQTHPSNGKLGGKCPRSSPQLDFGGRCEC